MAANALRHHCRWRRRRRRLERVDNCWWGSWQRCGCCGDTTPSWNWALAAAAAARIARLHHQQHCYEETMHAHHAWCCVGGSSSLLRFEEDSWSKDSGSWILQHLLGGALPLNRGLLLRVGTYRIPLRKLRWFWTKCVFHLRMSVDAACEQLLAGWLSHTFQLLELFERYRLEEFSFGVWPLGIWFWSTPKSLGNLLVRSLSVHVDSRQSWNPLAIALRLPPQQFRL